MNIFILFKGNKSDSTFIIKQFSCIKEIKKIFVFRDEIGYQNKKVIYIQPNIRKYELLKNMEKLFQMIRFRKFKPVIIIGIYEIPHGLLATFAGKILNIPSAISIIGNPAYKKIRRGFRNILTFLILKICNFVTVTGHNSKKYLLENGINTNKIFIMPNNISIESYYKMNIKKEYDLISLGRISAEKHIDIFVQIIASLKTSIPNIKAAIGGNGPELNKINDLIFIKKLENNIDLLGYIPDNKLRSFFNKGKIFILTSETEGLPRTLVQAAACCVPIVTSKVGDIENFIKHEENGFIVDQYDDIYQYVNLIKRLLKNKRTYHEFSKKIRLIAQENYSNRNSCNIWKKIIKNINTSST